MLKSLCLVLAIVLIYGFADLLAQNHRDFEEMSDTLVVQETQITPSNVPEGYHFDPDLGLLLHEDIAG